MDSRIFSPYWYRVADLQPRLRSHAKIHRHTYRGRVWYVLENKSNTRNHRFNAAAYHIIGLMDGKRSVDEIWEAANNHLNDEAPTQDEIIRLLGQLHNADLLMCEVGPDTEELNKRFEHLEFNKWKRRLWTPFSIRFSLVDPDKFLNRWNPLVGRLFTRPAVALWLIVVLSALVLAVINWTAITDDAVERILAPQSLLLLWLTYPVVKLLHELGHAFATKTWGGEVHDMGIMFLVFMPVPYVEASSASAFRDKKKRMVVGASGMMTELFIAALALFIWLTVETGIVSTIAYNVMLIGSVSTLFFNGNPLLRFDGYYLLADSIEIPNLSKRSTSYLGYLIQRYLFGVNEATSPVMAPGERAWFVGYGISAFIYRIGVMVAIILFVSTKFFVLGVVFAIWGILTQVAVPLIKQFSFLINSPLLHAKRMQVLTVTGFLIVAVLGVTLFMPMPLWTRAEGVVWLPEQSHVRANTDCFIVKTLTPVEAIVQQGEPIIECEDPFLAANVKVLEAELEELKIRLNVANHTDRVESEILKSKIELSEAEIKRARERLDGLIIRSPTDGKFVLPKVQDLPGRFFQQGKLIGYVIAESDITARVVVEQSDIGLVRQSTEAVEVRLAHQVSDVLVAAIKREVPAATDQLPSPALGSQGGGSIAIDPEDPKGMRVLEKLFHYELALPPEVQLDHVGGRVFVHFDHGTEPLASQWYRSIKQLFLRHFSV